MSSAADTTRPRQPRRWRRRPLAYAAVCVALAGALLAAPTPAAAQTVDVTVQRVPGSNVFNVAVAVAGGTCDSSTGSHSIALASGENWPDALAGRVARQFAPDDISTVCLASGANFADAVAVAPSRRIPVTLERAAPGHDLALLAGEIGEQRR